MDPGQTGIPVSRARGKRGPAGMVTPGPVSNLGNNQLSRSIHAPILIMYVSNLLPNSRPTGGWTLLSNSYVGYLMTVLYHDSGTQLSSHTVVSGTSTWAVLFTSALPRRWERDSGETATGRWTTDHVSYVSYLDRRLAAQVLYRNRLSAARWRGANHKMAFGTMTPGTRNQRACVTGQPLTINNTPYDEYNAG